MGGLIEEAVEESVDDVEVIESGKRKQPIAKIIVLLLGSFLTLALVRAAIVTPLDSVATRFGCRNHAEYLNDINDQDGVEGALILDPANSDQVKALVAEDVRWTVRGHVRSNKLGLIDRDNASCLYSTNLEGSGLISIPMSLASHGIFYTFGKLMGIMLQVGLVSAFIRWFHYRFMQ